MDKATSAVLFNGSIGDWFRTTIGVRQGCLLSPTLFNIFLERIMTDALEHHEGTVSIGGRAITNLRFADDIDGLAGAEEELAKLNECLDKASTAYGMEIGAEKTKLMTNNTSGINTEIKVNGQKLETVTSFQYLGFIRNDEGSKPEILSKMYREQQHRRLVPNNNWSPTGMSTLTHPLQHISGKDHDRRLRTS